MLRPRGDDRVAIITAPLSMTVVIGLLPSAVEAGIVFGAPTAPFGFAQGRLWKAVPFPVSGPLVAELVAASCIDPFGRLRTGSSSGVLGFAETSTSSRQRGARGVVASRSLRRKKLSRGWEGANKGKVVIALSKYLWKLCRF
jgi:hypothetical protein